MDFDNKKTNTKMQDFAILEVFTKYHQEIFEADFLGFCIKGKENV